MIEKKVRTSLEIDRKLWANFKAQCTIEDKTVAELLEQLIRQYLLINKKD